MMKGLASGSMLLPFSILKGRQTDFLILIGETISTNSTALG